MKAFRYSLFSLAMTSLIPVVSAPLLAQKSDALSPTTNQNTKVAVSPATAEIVEMFDAKVQHDVILAYVRNASQRFDISPDVIIYLRDLGIPSDVINAMIEQDKSVVPNEPATAPANTEAAATTPATNIPTPQAMGNVPPADASQVGPFYDALSPYGTWMYLNDVGWAWQPNVAATDGDWQPYSDAGNWVSSDAGWYWNSDYSWGWAPFHYGRWWRSPACGWVWCPGTVWGPSWVTWRVGEGFCGWAPLPPFGFGFNFGFFPSCFTFVSFNHFFDHDHHHHHDFNNFHGHDAHMFAHSHSVDNFEHGQGHNHDFASHHGIDPAQVAHATGKPIHTVPVVNSPHGWNSTSSHAFVHHGQVTAVTRTAPPASHTTTFTAQRVDASHPATPQVARSLSSSMTTVVNRQAFISRSPNAQPVFTQRLNPTTTTTPSFARQPIVEPSGAARAAMQPPLHPFTAPTRSFSGPAHGWAVATTPHMTAAPRSFTVAPSQSFSGAHSFSGGSVGHAPMGGGGFSHGGGSMGGASHGGGGAGGHGGGGGHR